MNVASDPNAGLFRLLVCAPPKSGSTYIANVMGRYFDADAAISSIQFEGDHNVTPFLAGELRGCAFSFNWHMIPHRMNLLLAQHERMALVAVWRNLGDMFLSMDAHLFREKGSGPAFYTADEENYRALPQEHRQLVSVDLMLTWYLRFYLMWRYEDFVLHPYEQMLTGKEAFFTRLIGAFGVTVDRERMFESLGGRGAVADRLNVGLAGRSAAGLADTVKRELEGRIMRHPDWQQLEILLWELPWSVPALDPVHPLDGQVVVSPDDGFAHFVSRGRRYPIARPSGLASRTGERRLPKVVDPAELEQLPVGVTLF